jgi:hypothetical protein
MAMGVARTSGERPVVTVAGSTACAQHPQVTHVGGHRPSSSRPDWAALHGSVTITLETPEALIASTPTMMTRTNRRTNPV